MLPLYNLYILWILIFLTNREGTAKITNLVVAWKQLVANILKILMWVGVATEANTPPPFKKRKEKGMSEESP